MGARRLSVASEASSERLSCCPQRTVTASGSSLFIDIGQGAGLAGATGVRPFLPPLWRARSRAGTPGIDFDGTDWQLPRVARLPAGACSRSPWSPTSAERSGANRRRSRDGCSRWWRAGARRAAVRRRRWPTAGIRQLARHRRRRAVRGARLLRGGGLARAGPRGGSTAGAAALLTAYADVSGAARSRRSRSSSRPRRILALAAFVGAAARAAAGARARSTRVCGSCGEPERRTPKKLVLAVIDALKPEMLEQAIERRARRRCSRRSCERGTYVRDCVSTFPSVTPVAAPAIATGLGPGRAPHPLDELVPPRRGALRGVRLVVPGHARLRRGALALRHGLQHEHGAPDPGAQDRVRAPRRRRPAHRLHHLPDLPRPHPPRAVRADALYRRLAEAAQFRHAVWGPGELFYADLFDSRNTGCPSTLGHARPARPAHRLRGRATWWRTTCSTSCSSRCPTTTRTRTRRGPDAQATLDRRGRPCARPDRCTPAGGAEAFLDEHAVIVMSDHSQTPWRTACNLADALGRLARPAPADPAPDRGRARRLPGRALGDGLCARRRSRRDELAPASPRDAARARGRGPGRCARDGDEARGVDRARRAALRARRRADRRPARAGPGGCEGEPAALALEIAGRARERLPRRARPRCGRPSSARTRATCWSRPAGLRVRGLGRVATTWAAAATGRCTATIRSACCCSAASDRARRCAEQWALTRRDAAGARSLRCTLGAMTEELDRRRHARSASGPRARARWPAPARTTGCSSRSSAPWAARATS